MELLKNMAVAGGASSLQSVELQISLEEMMEMCWKMLLAIFKLQLLLLLYPICRFYVIEW